MKRIVKDKSWCTDKVYLQLEAAGNILEQSKVSILILFLYFKALNCNKILSINPNNVAVRTRITSYLKDLYGILAGNSPLASTIHMSKAIPDPMALENLVKNSYSRMDKLGITSNIQNCY
jgi:hypothetical protein